MTGIHESILGLLMIGGITAVIITTALVFARSERKTSCPVADGTLSENCQNDMRQGRGAA